MTGLVERDAAVFLHQEGSTPVGMSFAAVEGVWAEDDSGHRFMDFQGNTCHNIGYAHPRLIAALKDQLERLPFTPRRFTNEPAVALAERLSALWPYGAGRVLFGLSGADAIEMAMKLAFVATGRKGTLAFEDSWHGAALGALWAGGRAAERVGFPAFEGCRHAVPFWPREPGGDHEAAAERSLEAIRRALRSGEISCLLAEPIRSTPHVPPPWFWPAVRRLCDETGTLLIFDEIPTGLGKTGRLFSSEHFEAPPDVTVIGKSLGGGALPLSALIARPALNVAGPWAIGHYTHQKSPLLARAGLTTLDVLLDEDLPAAAARKGMAFLARLQDLAAASPLFRGARGLGLLMALEVAEPSELDSLQRRLFEKGLSLGAAEDRFLGLSPPLTIAEAEIDRALDILASLH